MLFTPNYIVSYKGALRPAGKPFEIDPQDRAEMERHGRVMEDRIVKTEISAKPAEVSAQPAKKGRPRKVSES